MVPWLPNSRGMPKKPIYVVAEYRSLITVRISTPLRSLSLRLVAGAFLTHLTNAREPDSHTFWTLQAASYQLS
jgi:hypothetical protein